MPDLQARAALAEIVGAATGAGGAGFALAQIRGFRRQRREAAAIELVRSILTPDFSHRFRQIWEMPEGAAAGDIRGRGRDLEAAVAGIVVPMQTLAVLVYKRILDHRIGGFVRDAWRTLRPHVEDARRRLGTSNPSQRLPWLAGRLQEHSAPAKREGAVAAYRDGGPAPP